MKLRKGKRLPSYDDLITAAAAVFRNADADEKVAIAGGLAMQVWGSPRLTGDLDVIADSRLGYEGDPLTFGGVRTHVGSVQLDVIIRSDEWASLYADALRHAEPVEGVPALVVTPEYLVAMKMVAGRPKDEGDVRYLVLTADFDRQKAEAVVREHLGAYAVKELRSVIAEAEWRRSRGEES